MMSWMQRAPYTNAMMPQSLNLLHPFPIKSAPTRSSARDKLPDDLPDYCVYVTKHSLLAFTTSLTDVSTEAHSYFVKLNYAFAMERVMRSFMQWGGVGIAAPSTPMTALQSWFAAANPAPKPVPYFVPQRSHLPRPSTAAPETYAAASQNASQSVTGAFNAMMAFSTACLNAAPVAMDAWRLSAPR